MYKTYNTPMKIVSTTNVRKSISALINRVRDSGETFGIGRRDAIDAILIPFPREYRKEVSDITNINAYSRSFDFLENELDLYSESDLKERYG